MTSIRQPQCATCSRWIPGLRNKGVQTCAAFPDRIPAEVWRNEVDHREPVAGDRGLLWTPAKGATFPKYAFAKPI